MQVGGQTIRDLNAMHVVDWRRLASSCESFLDKTNPKQNIDEFKKIAKTIQ